MQLISISYTARFLEYKSRSQLYKLINDGWLDEHLHVNMPIGQRLLDVEGLQEKLKGLFQWRIDSVYLRRCPPLVRWSKPSAAILKTKE